MRRTYERDRPSPAPNTHNREESKERVLPTLSESRRSQNLLERSLQGSRLQYWCSNQRRNEIRCCVFVGMHQRRHGQGGKWTFYFVLVNVDSISYFSTVFFDFIRVCRALAKVKGNPRPLVRLLVTNGVPFDSEWCISGMRTSGTYHATR